MKTLIIIISVLTCQATLCQDVNFGINVGTNPYNKFSFQNTTDFYKPVNSFVTYQAKEQGSGLIFDEHKFFNTVHFGGSVRISRKKIGINIEPQMLIEYIQFNFTDQHPNNWRTLSRKGFRLPIYLTYHLFNNPLSFHLNAGIIVHSMEINDYQRPDLAYFTTEEGAWQNNVDYGDNHFYDVFYNNKNFNVNYLFGIGKKIKKLDYNLRYVSALTPDNIKGTRWQVEFHINYFFLSKDEFNTKNYLYEE